METRSPFQNDLIVDPGQSAVLHESNTLSKRAKFNTKDIGLSFEWMLSVPSPIDEHITSIDAVVEPTLLASMSIPHFKNYSKPSIVMSWNQIPFYWHSLCRRKIQIKFVCVKCFTPGKLAVEHVFYQPDYGVTYDTKYTDIKNKRNLYSEHDITANPIVVKEFNGIYYKGSKWSTTPTIDLSYLDGEQGFKERDPLNAGEMDGMVNIIQPIAYQRGMLYPNTFNIYPFISYAGTTLQTITHPGMLQTQASAPNGKSTELSVPLIPTTVGSKLFTYFNASLKP